MKMTTIINRMLIGSLLWFFYLVIWTIKSERKKDSELQKEHMEYCKEMTKILERIDKRLLKAGFTLN